MADRDGDAPAGADGATDVEREANRLAHDARNSLNTLSLTLQLVERVVASAEVTGDARRRLLARIEAAAPEVEKVRGALEGLRLLAGGEEGRG